VYARRGCTNGVQVLCKGNRGTLFSNSTGSVQERSRVVELLRSVPLLHFDEVPEENWTNLFKALLHQKEIFEKNITNEEGPKKKINVTNALNHLLSILENYLCQEMMEAA
jgi:hypothetical protein